MAARITIGIDEAGRGPAIGPLVMAVCALDTNAARALSRAGLADSKSYGAGDKARARRAELADLVRSRATFFGVEVVSVEEIDSRVARGELNALERDVALRLLTHAPKAHRIIADGRTMFSPLCARVPRLEALDGAESIHASVAAASVLAKVERDRCFEEICARYHAEFGEIRGGGYVNAATRTFLRAYATNYRALLPEARRSWPHPYLADLIDVPTVAASQLQLMY